MTIAKKMLPPALVVAALLNIAQAAPASGQAAEPSTNATSSASRPKVPDLRDLVASFKTNEMKAVTQRYQADRSNLTRYYNVTIAPERCARLRYFGEDWQTAVQNLDSNSFSEEARAETTRLLDVIRHDLQQVNDETRGQTEIAPRIPFSNIIFDLDARKRRMERVDAQQIAGVVDDLAKRVAAACTNVDQNGPAGEPNQGAPVIDASQFHRAAESVQTMRTVLKNWFSFYNDYDPMFTWWLAQPYKEADKALTDYASLLGKKSEGHSSDTAGDKPHSSLTETLPSVTPIKLPGKTVEVPDLTELIDAPPSRMRAVIDRYTDNNGGRGGGGRGGGGGRLRSPEYYRDWLGALQKVDFGTLTRDDQIDYLLLKNRVEYQLHRLDFRTNADEDTGAFLPFQPTVEKLNEATDQREKFDLGKATDFLQGLKKDLAGAREAASNQFEKSDAVVAGRAGRAARALGGLRNQLQDWRDRNSADWQTNETLDALFKAADDGMDDYASYLREKSGVTARRDGSDIVGRPIGPDELKLELDAEMISYTPEELVAIAEKEFAWCVAEMKRASREMGLGDDWRAALEKVKDQHVPAGDQPYLIRDLAWEAVDYLEANDLITIPEIARESWRMQMMSLQRQMVNPFFTGGDTISVSYPLSEMSHDQKLQSMRGNNIPFARATVFHELIPGHELQGFTAARYHTERRAFSTAFYVEGWAVYWELLLYERHFHGSPENRMGALFWRLHRCARIIFSLNFHLKRWTPQQCIDYLVAEVGHERDNATAEVRRSFGTSYGPLYQAGYLLGALQLRALHRELAKSGMSDRDFHDAVLKEGSIPVAMLRASLTKEPLNPDYRPDWRFYDATSDGH